MTDNQNYSRWLLLIIIGIQIYNNQNVWFINSCVVIGTK